MHFWQLHKFDLTITDGISGNVILPYLIFVNLNLPILGLLRLHPLHLETGFFWAIYLVIPSLSTCTGNKRVRTMLGLLAGLDI